MGDFSSQALNLLSKGSNLFQLQAQGLRMLSLKFLEFPFYCPEFLLGLHDSVFDESDLLADLLISFCRVVIDKFLSRIVGSIHS